MQYRRLGNSNLVVSRLWLGGMSLGSPKPRPWVADANTSRQIISAALNAGINVIDTADAYAAGESENVIGTYLDEMGVRDEIIIATKFGLPLGSRDPNRNGYSRRNIVQRCEAALRRLKTDRIDILQTHIWRPETDIEEAAEAFELLIQQGKVLYAGVTDMPAWQAAKWIYTCRYKGLSPLVSMQHHYNPLWREDERELVPLCQAEGVGLLAYSPIGRGFLAGTARETQRAATDDMIGRFYGRAADLAMRDMLIAASRDAGLTPAQLALRWVLDRPHVTGAVVGPTNAAQLADLVVCTEPGTEIEPEIAARIDAAYLPRSEVGHG